MRRDELEALIQTHQAEIYRYVRYIGAAGDVAEDIVQETFLIAFRSGTSADAKVQPSWLRGVAKNLFLKHCRQNRTDRIRFDSDLVERSETTWSSGFLHGGDGFDYIEALRRCLEALSEKHRKAADLRYAHGKPRSEMARLLEMTENGVKDLLRTVRARLAECIRKRLKLEEA